MLKVATTAGTYVDLGMADNDTLPSVTITDHIHEIKTSASGAVPEELVLQGISATITVTLVKWDVEIWEALQAHQRGAAFTADIGTMMVNNATPRVFGVQLAPVEATQAGYTFTRCYLMNDTSDSNFGNVERRLAITFRAIPDNNGQLCTYAAIT
jgi:hypothetical protein